MDVRMPLSVASDMEGANSLSRNQLMDSQLTVPNGARHAQNGNGQHVNHRSQLSYSDSTVNLDDIYLRQLGEDIDAYKHDLDFCDDTLTQPDLTPQEARTIQLRRLDLAHQLRQCRHRVEVLSLQRPGAEAVQSRNTSTTATTTTTTAAATPDRIAGFTNPGATQHSSTGRSNGIKNGGFAMKFIGSRKRDASSLDTPRSDPFQRPASKRPKVEYDLPEAEPSAGSSVNTTAETAVASSPSDTVTDPSLAAYDEDRSPLPSPGTVRVATTTAFGSSNGGSGGVIAAAAAGQGGETRLQRLGSWRCRLCTSRKYLLAGAGRVPAAPCKWELKDVAKMIVHFTEMHTEHTAAERCAELGAALRRNRGPFEYWIRRTRQQNVGDGSIVGECIEQLEAGKLPALLRKLSRAAALFPSDS